jgi:signal transduction histidine kinase
MGSRFFHYGVTPFIIALALACQLLLYSVTPVTAPFMFFTFVVLLTTWFVRWEAGILATVLSTGVLEYLFIHPVGFYVRAPLDYIASVTFLAGTGFIVLLVAAKKRSDERLAHLKDELERRVAERTEALEKAMKELAAKQTLASIGLAATSIAHEIANPLQTISLGLRVLELELAESSQVLDQRTATHLSAMNGEVSRLLSLLGELRDVSRPSKLELCPVDLKREMCEVIRSQETFLAARGVEVVNNLPDDLPAVMADTDKLKRVIFNLCKNAVDAMPDGGTLSLRGHTDQNYVCFEIQDTGQGIPEGANVFAAFATSKPEGWGLGLQIVYQIVSSHNGRVEYDSTPGSGTTFKVCLPAAEEK